MKALILNSGLGRRMGNLTWNHPKCMTEISECETILSRQLRILNEIGIRDVIMTTGYYEDVLVEYCNSLKLPINVTFVNNPLYAETNYIYSIFCAREFLDDDIILMHGDLVFEKNVLQDMLSFPYSCIKVSSTVSLPDKDFKAVIKDGRIERIGIEYFDNALEAQALYKVLKNDWNIWLDEIIRFCKAGNCKCYAENAFNNISGVCKIYPYDVKDRLCAEIDTQEDLIMISDILKKVDEKTVYMCFSTDMIHSGHISLIRKAEKLGKLIIGVLSDEAIITYKRFQLMPFEERKYMFEKRA